MRRNILFRLFMLAGILWFFQTCTILSAQDLVIRGGWVFDTNRESFVRNKATVIRNGVFLFVANSYKSWGNGMTVIDLEDDDYILPGIFDLHAHYNVNLFGVRRREEFTVNPVVFLANGVTSTFPAGSYDPEGMLRLREKIDRGEKIGPRIFNSGPYFGRARPGWDQNMTTEEIYREVDKWAEKGVAGFKAKGISRNHLKALIARAHLHGLTVTGHLGSGFHETVNPMDAILLGIDRVEHFLGGADISSGQPAYASLVHVRTNTWEFKEVVNFYLNHHVFFDATISAYGYYGKREEGYDYWTNERIYFTDFVRDTLRKNPRLQTIEQFEQIYHVKQKTIKAFYDAGGGDLITLGTDHPSAGEYLAGFAAHRELEVLVRSGIPPAAVIKMATINGARALNVAEKLGSIEPGKFADLFVVKGNPIKDIHNTRHVYIVVKAGLAYYSESLLTSVEGKLGPANAEEAKEW